MPGSKQKSGSGYKYLAVAERLEGEILSGRRSVGARLPSERQLAVQHGVTIMTVRGALQVLADKGLISREQGRGTFVAIPGAPESAGPAVKPIGLIGLDPDPGSRPNSINWQVCLRRLQGVVDGTAQLGLPIQTRADPDGNGPVSRLLAGLERFSGLVLHEESLPESVLLSLYERAIPVVAINCYLDVGYCSRIHVNSRLGATLAVRHLVGLGHRRIAILVGDPARLSMGERLQGYRDALAAHGLPLDEDLVLIEPRGWPQDASDATRRLLALPDPPTAIFAASDYRAIGVLEQLERSGISVPEAMAVVGFDDIREATTTTPPLTTLANPHYESGRLAARILGDRIRRKKAGNAIHVMNCRLTVRASCGAVLHEAPGLKSKEKA